MPHATQPPNWPTARGPWPEVTDTSRLYDHGKPWCACAHGHPDPEDGYPDTDRHLPWNECRTLVSYFDGARRDLDGPPAELELYAAAAFQFGTLRHTAVSAEARIVLEAYTDGSGEEPLRVSLAIGEALLLGRRIAQLVDLLSVLQRVNQ